MIIDKYLYEIIDDYKSTNSEEEKNKIINSFFSSIWGNKNKRRTYIKTIKFKVRSDLLESEIGQIFNTWSEVEYVGYKAMTNDTDWCSLIRQKINNIYTRYFDEDVVLKKDYMDLLKTPKNLYYRWIKGFEINSEELTDIIESSIYKAIELKSAYRKQKMKLSWDEYKNVVEGFLQRAIDNCKLIEEYEINNLTSKYIYDFISEDNFYIRYICKSLEGEMLKWQKQYYGVSRNKKSKYERCRECGRLIEIKSKNDFSTKYCNECKEQKKLEKYNKYNAKRKAKKFTTEPNLYTQP